MGCETEQCRSCKIEIGAMQVVPGGYHLFIMYHDGEKMIVYRGGPEVGSRYGELAAQGQATEYNSDGVSGDGRGAGDTDRGLGRLVIHRMEGTDGNVDYRSMMRAGGQDRITIAEGPEYCGLDGKLSAAAAKIGRAGIMYETPFALGKPDNSNAVVRTMLNELALPERSPSVYAPGWAKDLFPPQHVPVGRVSSARLPETRGMIRMGEEMNGAEVFAEEAHRARQFEGDGRTAPPLIITPPRQHVPVGRVSSAQLPGTQGTAPAGTEADALNIGSEERRRK